MKYKLFESIDGLFKSKLKYGKVKSGNKLKIKRISIFGKGNSISSIPFHKKSNLISLNDEENININYNDRTVSVNGNLEVYKIHNYLLKKKFYFPSFPSYPNATIGACVANCTHGINPKDGVIKNYLKEITLYNPNFGKKIISRKKNKKLFELTLGGMGLTGIILKVTLKVLVLKSSYIYLKEKKKFNTIYELYFFLKKKSFKYNQNNIFFNIQNSGNILSKLSSGNFFGKNSYPRIIDIKRINKFRLGLLKYFILRNLLEKILIISEYFFLKKKIHISDAFYPSNSKLLYFSLMPKKFIEHQTIIPHKNVRKFFLEFDKIIKIYSPQITLGHLKIFNGKGNYLQFNGKGLALTLHLIIYKNFNLFYKKFLELNLKLSCKPNLYKNSLISIDYVKKFYGKNYIYFQKEIKKINKNFIFENRLFNKENFY
jgi:hypothetical protein